MEYKNSVTIFKEKKIDLLNYYTTFIYSQSLSKKPAERKSPKKYFFLSYFVLTAHLGYEPALYV